MCSTFVKPPRIKRQRLLISPIPVCISRVICDRHSSRCPSWTSEAHSLICDHEVLKRHWDGLLIKISHVLIMSQCSISVCLALQEFSNKNRQGSRPSRNIDSTEIKSIVLNNEQKCSWYTVKIFLLVCWCFTLSANVAWIDCLHDRGNAMCPFPTYLLTLKRRGMTSELAFPNRPAKAYCFGFQLHKLYVSDMQWRQFSHKY